MEPCWIEESAPFRCDRLEYFEQDHLRHHRPFSPDHRNRGQEQPLPCGVKKSSQPIQVEVEKEMGPHMDSKCLEFSSLSCCNMCLFFVCPAFNRFLSYPHQICRLRSQHIASRCCPVAQASMPHGLEWTKRGRERDPTSER